MKRITNLLFAGGVLAACCYAQAQDAPAGKQMMVPEFRQTLVDLGTYLDAHKGTDLARQFAALPDDVLARIYPAVSNPYKLQSAVAALKQHDLARAAARGGLAIPGSPRNLSPEAVVGSCAPNSIVDNSPGSACTPAYPDPNNSAWQNLVNPLITFGAFSPTDYPDVSMQQCSLTVESNLVQVVSALNGTVTVAAIACGALTIIGQPICDGAVAAVGVAGAVSQGLLADCSEQDGNVNSAEIDAAFHNTVTIFNRLGTVGQNVTTIGNNLTTIGTNLTNQITAVDTDLETRIASADTDIDNRIILVDQHLGTRATQIDTEIATRSTQIDNEVAAANQLINANIATFQALELRLKIEQNLLTGLPIGLFETPQSLGGYFELVRSILVDTIAKQKAQGFNEDVPNAQLLLGDHLAATGNYKAAYTYYQTAYTTAVHP